MLFYISHIEGIQQKQIENILKTDLNISSKKELLMEYEKMIHDGIKFITKEDKEYPEKLKNIYDFPYWLYVKGNVSILNELSVAIIGSRNCSKYGENVAKDIAIDLAEKNITVVSGMARGIDTYAHIGSLIGNGKTIAVLGSGFDNIYPKENEMLIKKILEKGRGHYFRISTGS